MSICNGVAGWRGNPKGIFIHNDAGSQNANVAFYKNWLPTHPLENGFAHAYVAQDGTLFAEDDMYGAWHCGNSTYNRDYYSIEVCQSRGDLAVFKQNEENALKLAADKCKKYGITPDENTIRLHKEVYSTSCPHRSVEIHGGDYATKQYFIQRIKEYMDGYANPGKNAWLEKNGFFYWQNENGDIVKGWKAINYHWYYFDADGKMSVGWRKIDGKYYYFGASGNMLTGWQIINGYFYFLTPPERRSVEHPHGSMQTGFVDDGRYTYFLREKADHGIPQGAMVNGWYDIDGKTYFFNTNGKGHPNGSMLRNHWVGKYYLKDNGEMAKNETLAIGGKEYKFDKNGVNE